MAWTLCSKEDVQNLHPIAETELQDQWSEQVEALIRQHLGTPYLGTTQSITEELHSGDDTSILRVNKPPIISVSELKINTVTITAADYAVFPTYIQLKSQTFIDGTLNVSVSYVSGGITVDPTIKLAAAAMIIAIINYNRRMGADGSIRWGRPEERLGEETPNRNPGLTSHLTIIMKRLLRRKRVRAR